MGVTVETISSGDHRHYPTRGDRVTVHYVGKLLNGRTVDSSRQRGHPVTFKVGSGDVIRGWDEGIQRMSLGQRAMLTCSPSYAYGNRGFGRLIPPNATILYEVQLVRIERPPPRR